MVRVAVAILVVLALGASPAAAATWVKDVPAEDVADTIACPAGSTLDASIVALETAYVRADPVPVGGVTYVRTSIHGDHACPTRAAFEVIPPPGAELAADVPVECAYRISTAPAPCPVVTGPGAYGGTAVADGRSGTATLFDAPDDLSAALYVYFPIRVRQAFGTFQASAQASCNAAPCPPAQGNGRVQIAAQFFSGAAQSRDLYSSVGLTTADPSAGVPAPPTPGPPTSVPPAPGGSAGDGAGVPSVRGTASISRRGVVSLSLACKGAAGCAGRAAIRVPRARRAGAPTTRSKAYAIRAGRTAKIRVALGRAGRASVARRGRARVRVTLTLTPTGARKAARTQRLRLKVTRR